MTMDTFLADFKAENEVYDSMGLIDEVSIYRWVDEALRPFGQNIMLLHDAVIKVCSKKAHLPDNFDTLYAAMRCEPFGYHVAPEHNHVVQRSRQWLERTEHSKSWNMCEPCCDTTTEKVITERIFIEDAPVNFYFHRPTWLHVDRHISSRFCHGSCKNFMVERSPYSISINKKTVHTNFHDGYIYVQYYGTPTDEEGRPIIPDVGNGALETHVWNYVHKKFFEKLLRNKDDTNITTLFQYYIEESKVSRVLASTDVKMATLSPETLYRLTHLNRRDMLRYELNFGL